MGIWEGLKRGTKALIRGDRLGPGTFLAGGQKVMCPHCKSATFFEGRGLLTYQSRLKDATTLMCDHCGLIQWFGVGPERSGTAQERPEAAGDA
jgi:hypothetical protein